MLNAPQSCEMEAMEWFAGGSADDLILKGRGDGWKVAMGGRIADATSPTTLSRKFCPLPHMPHTLELGNQLTPTADSTGPSFSPGHQMCPWQVLSISGVALGLAFSFVALRLHTAKCS